MGEEKALMAAYDRLEMKGRNINYSRFFLSLFSGSV